MLDSHCNTCNADGAVYQTHQQLITANDIIVVQLKVYVFGIDGMVHKLNVSVNVTEHEKIGLMCTKYTCSYFEGYLPFCIWYPRSVSFI